MAQDQDQERGKEARAKMGEMLGADMVRIAVFGEID